MTRVALAIAYDGTRFESYARQPGRRTVEGELVNLLRRAGAFEDAKAARFRSGSRTDAGVSAAWNVVAFDSRILPEAVVAAGVKAPPGLLLLSAAEAPADFEPRRARSRTYRYFLDAPLDWKRVKPAAQLFVGPHDFSNFRRADEGKPPHARIEKLMYRGAPRGPWLEVTGPFFLWNQVRRMAAALQGVHDRRWSAADVKRALEEPHDSRDFGVAPAQNLLLVSVEYGSLTFPPATKTAARRFEEEQSELRRRGAWIDAVRARSFERPKVAAAAPRRRGSPTTAQDGQGMAARARGSGRPAKRRL